MDPPGGLGSQAPPPFPGRTFPASEIRAQLVSSSGDERQDDLGSALGLCLGSYREFPKNAGRNIDLKSVRARIIRTPRKRTPNL